MKQEPAANAVFYTVETSGDQQTDMLDVTMFLCAAGQRLYSLAQVSGNEVVARDFTRIVANCNKLHSLVVPLCNGSFAFESSDKFAKFTSKYRHDMIGVINGILGYICLVEELQPSFYPKLVNLVYKHVKTIAAQVDIFFKNWQSRLPSSPVCLPVSTMPVENPQPCLVAVVATNTPYHRQLSGILKDHSYTVAAFETIDKLLDCSFSGATDLVILIDPPESECDQGLVNLAKKNHTEILVYADDGNRHNCYQRFMQPVAPKPYDMAHFVQVAMAKIALAQQKTRTNPRKPDTDFYDALLQSAGQMVMVSDARNRLEYISPGLAKTLKAKPARLYGKLCHEVGLCDVVSYQCRQCTAVGENGKWSGSVPRLAANNAQNTRAKPLHVTATLHQQNDNGQIRIIRHITPI